MNLPEDLKLRIISGAILFSFAVFIILLGGLFYTAAILVIALFCAGEFFMIASQNLNKNTVENSKKWIYIGVVSIGIPALSLIIIRNVFWSGILTSFWLFLLVSLVDIFAYFTGKLFGKHKLAPNISPSKTIEGLIGGLTITVAVSTGFFFFFHSKLNLVVYICLTAVLAVISQISDIMESAFKRKFNVKDSSNIIPGHGGFMDRLDGYFLTSPALLIFYFISYSIFGYSIF